MAASPARVALYTSVAVAALAIGAQTPGPQAKVPALETVQVLEGTPLPPGARIAAARQYLRGRRGIAAFALVDSQGRLHSLGGRRMFVAASVSKAMLLVAYLRKIDGRLPSVEERRLLGPMIVRSDNRAATAVHRRVGDDALRRLARRAGMRRFAVLGSWSRVYASAPDLARFFRRLERLLPARSRRFALHLLSSIVPRQRWGFSRFAQRAGFATHFKGGWRRTARGRLVHEAALFLRGRERLSMAVLTDANRSHAYGTATLRGVAARIFPPPAAAAADAGTPATRRAGLVDLERYAPTARIDMRYATRRNVTGRPLPGYCQPWALLLRRAAADLGRVERRLRRRGLGLKVLDAYRPARASRALVRWAERTGRGHLVGTYIARRSRHNLGSAVDLTLVRARSGRQLPMGTRYDSFSPRAHTRNATGEVLRNRLTLVRAMAAHGFANYRREWWHFEHRVAGRRYLDLTLGCEN